MAYFHVISIASGNTLYPRKGHNGRSPTRARELGGKGTVTGKGVTSQEAYDEAIKALEEARKQ